MRYWVGARLVHARYPPPFSVSTNTHLLRVLKDEANAAREGSTSSFVSLLVSNHLSGARAKEQLRQLKDSTRKGRGERARERRHFIAVARLLHTTLQVGITDAFFKEEIADLFSVLKQKFCTESPSLKWNNSEIR